MSYKIGSFNCLNYGSGASKEEKVFANIIIKENFDIIALQEIKNKFVLDIIINCLNNLSIYHWKGKHDNGDANDYAFIWNSDRMELAYTKTDKGLRTYEPRIYKQYKINKSEGQTNLIREPFFARFYPCHPGAPFIEIRIINCHIRYTKGNNDDEYSLGAVQMRKNEFNILTKSIYAKESDHVYGSNRPSYTIMLGDYNLNRPSSSAKAPYLVESFEIIDANKVKKISTIQNDLTTLKKNRSEDQNIYANNFDHFTIDDIRFRDVDITCQRVDAIDKYCDSDHDRYYKHVSDHLPITLDLNIRKG